LDVWQSGALWSHTLSHPHPFGRWLAGWLAGWLLATGLDNGQEPDVALYTRLRQSGQQLRSSILSSSENSVSSCTTDALRAVDTVLADRVPSVLRELRFAEARSW